MAQHSPVDAEAPMTPWSPELLKLTIGMVVTNAANAFSAFAVATMLPRTVADLGGIGAYGWAFSAYMLANIVGLTIAGIEGDRRGPRLPFLAGVLCFSAGLFIAGLAPTMWVFIAGRAIQGFGGGLFGSSLYVVIGRRYPAAAKPRMLAVMSSSGVVPALIGPALAGALADLVGWRAVFFTIFPLMLLAASLAYPSLRALETPAASGGSDTRRLLQAVLLASGAVLTLLGLGSSRPLFAVPAVMLGMVATLTMLGRMLPPGTLRFAPGLPAAIGLMLLVSLAYFGVDAFVPLALTEIRARSASFAGLALTAAALAWTGGTWVQAHVSDQWSRRRVIRIGMATIIVSIAGFTATLFDTVPVMLAPVAWGLSGLGMGLAYSGVSLTVLQTAESGREGNATSGMQIGFVLGTAFGTGIGGAWLRWMSDGSEAERSALVAQFSLMAFILVIAIVLARGIPAWPGTPVPSRTTDGG